MIYSFIHSSYRVSHRRQLAPSLSRTLSLNERIMKCSHHHFHCYYNDCKMTTMRRRRRSSPPLLFRRFGLFLLLMLMTVVVDISDAGISCKTTYDCQNNLEVISIPGDSKCVNGFCTNPFQQGCLRAMELAKNGSDSQKATTTTTKTKSSSDEHYKDHNDPNHDHDHHHDYYYDENSKKKRRRRIRSFDQRVCNSDDDDETNGSSNNCHQPYSHFHDYPEVRIGAGDWESSIFLAWILQILLGELLQVPVTIETSSPKSAGSLSFYDEFNGMVYPSVPYNYNALKRAAELDGDCSSRADLNSGNDPCAHILPEVWSGQINAYTDAQKEGFIEPPEGNGMVGKFSFMIPRFATEADPSLTSWHGLQDRRKMAETFLRPTTWLEYCTEVSVSNCSSTTSTITEDHDDKMTAKRYPQTPVEEEKYFVPGLYTGHFRATDQNNCTMYPDSCSGHVVDPPCDWDTLTESQMYWNNISLTSSGPMEPNHGYGYFQMIDIWHAANATKSPVFLWWWKPDSLDQLFANTDFALQPTFLPPPTEACEKSRVKNVDRCSDDHEARLGSLIGSCDTPAHALQKVISTGLYASAFAESEATRSPAYDFIKRFRVSDLSLTIMLRKWIHTQQDMYGIDPRIAVCEWVYDNIDVLQETFLPPDYPRYFEEEISKPMFYTSFALGFVALAMALVACFGTYKYRDNLIFRYAHVPFVMWILLGLVMVSVGAILVAPHPTNALCFAQPYLITLGYTIELMPLIVKVTAVNHLIYKSRRMTLTRKVHINTKRLHLQVCCVAALVFIYLISWSILDPRVVVETAYLVEQGEPGDVGITTMCRSSSPAWAMTTYFWLGFHLLSALILALQSRNIKQEFNESQSLAFMVYSHTLFLVLRALICALPPENFRKGNIQQGWNSICISLDCINTLLVYFAPKFYVIAQNKDVRTNDDSSSRSPRSVSSIASREEESRGGGVISRASNLLRSTMTSLGYNNNHHYDETSPKGNEFKMLMGEACSLLVMALEEEERQAQIDTADDGTVSTLEQKENQRLKNNFFMPETELVLLRDICGRMSRARFDWERDPNTTSGIIGGGGRGSGSPTRGGQSTNNNNNNTRMISWASDLKSAMMESSCPMSRVEDVIGDTASQQQQQHDPQKPSSKRDLRCSQQQQPLESLAETVDKKEASREDESTD